VSAEARGFRAAEGGRIGRQYPHPPCAAWACWSVGCLSPRHYHCRQLGCKCSALWPCACCCRGCVSPGSSQLPGPAEWGRPQSALLHCCLWAGQSSSWQAAEQYLTALQRAHVRSRLPSGRVAAPYTAHSRAGLAAVLADWRRDEVRVKSAANMLNGRRLLSGGGVGAPSSSASTGSPDSCRGGHQRPQLLSSKDEVGVCWQLLPSQALARTVW
jgi:hypothetical protein